MMVSNIINHTLQPCVICWCYVWLNTRSHGGIAHGGVLCCLMFAINAVLES